MLDELIDATTHDFFTILQVEIFFAKKNGKTYALVFSDFKLSGNAPLVTCLIRIVILKFFV